MEKGDGGGSQKFTRGLSRCWQSRVVYGSRAGTPALALALFGFPRASRLADLWQIEGEETRARGPWRVSQRLALPVRVTAL